MHSQTPILDSWLYFMKDTPPPSSFIEMSFYGMISAALQRRVYLGSSTWPIFPNNFTVLVGPPATGKSLSITPVKKVLESFKQRRLVVKQDDVKTMSSAEQLETIEALTKEYMQSNDIKKLHGMDAVTKKEPLLIPIASQATTYEALVKAHADSLRTVCPITPNDMCKDGMYSHSSLACMNDEISSLFRKHTDDLVNYLIKSYDCENYDYDTKGSGSHFVKSPCLTLLGGTQPNFIKRVYSDQLLTEGFSSRTIFVYEEKPRFYLVDIPEPTPEQLAARQRVVDHVGKLTKCFGQVSVSPEAHAYMKYMVEEYWPKNRINKSDKLDHYYGRKTIHFKKLMIGMHFGESTEMTIELPTAKRSAEKLDSLEVKMDMALNTGGRNRLSGMYEKVFKFIKLKGGANRIEIWTTFIDDFDDAKEVDEVLTYLIATNKVKVNKDLYIEV